MESQYFSFSYFTNVWLLLGKILLFTDEQLKEILMGAHVRLDDDGETYEEWEDKVVNKQSRYSSHSSDKTQYGVNTRIFYTSTKKFWQYCKKNIAKSIAIVLQYFFPRSIARSIAILFSQSIAKSIAILFKSIANNPDLAKYN